MPGEQAPSLATLRPLVEQVAQACADEGRDPATLRRSLDIFSVAAPGVPALPASATELQIGGSPETVAEAFLAYRELGFEKVRCNLRVPADRRRTEAIAWMGEVVARVQAAWAGHPRTRVRNLTPPALKGRRPRP